jgi:chaperonin cofactor prefoldin
MGILLYGENSLSVLTQLKEKKATLLKEEQALKQQNQKLQKRFFVLKQLEPKEE